MESNAIHAKKMVAVPDYLYGISAPAIAPTLLSNTRRWNFTAFPTIVLFIPFDIFPKSNLHSFERLSTEFFNRPTSGRINVNMHQAVTFMPIGLLIAYVYQFSFQYFSGLEK